jgi:riboflavin kinase/FMN adenylyltransferase
MVIFPDDNDLKLVNTQKEKIDLLEERELDHLIIHPFTRDFSRLNSTEFVRDILVNQLDIKKLIIGYDHHFGRNREGTYEDLVELANLYKFEIERIDAQEFNDTKVSSTKIRKALESGEVQTANHYLGYDFRLTGVVIEGQKLGRKLGFPTANIKVSDTHKLIPANGVYATRVIIDGEIYNGMMNIGTRPSVALRGEKTIEVNIFDFDASIYGKEITLSLVSRIRDEKKFDQISDLQKQLEIDQNKCLGILA